MNMYILASNVLPWHRQKYLRGSLSVCVILLGQLVAMWSINELECLDTLVGSCTICCKWKTSSSSLYCLVVAQFWLSKSMFMWPVSINRPSQLLLMWPSISSTLFNHSCVVKTLVERYMAPISTLLCLFLSVISIHKCSRSVCTFSGSFPNRLENLIF